ncbi:hypothetical protein BGZ81_004956 [Podila clonocystis]|nr:hypothetical protein BGZ81_004956 [Podila clonocystis]
MPSLLRDIYSVDVRFGFKTAGQESDIRLWAYRTVLAKYPMFDDLLKQSSFENKSSPLGSLKLSVTKVSFPVFATLLKFLYTGVVDRMVYPSDFAISKIPVVWPQVNPAGGNKEKYEWHRHPLDLEKPLSPTPVSWKNLLNAATVYKVHALCARCEAALKSGAEDGKAITTDTK